jgi:septal ring factor EnvC (AmiA/AmiB activator)
LTNLIYIFVLLFAGIVFGQADIDNEIAGNRQQLSKVKDEIQLLRNEIARSDIKASSTLEQIKYLDKEIALLSSTKSLLAKQNLLLSRKITITRDYLEDQYTQRVINLYKHGKVQNIELLINSASINQALVRYKYLKLFNDQEKQVIHKISSQVEEIQILERELSLVYQNQRQSLQEKEKQQSNYLARKDEKKVLVKRMRWNSQNLNKRLKSAEDEYQKLYQLIVALEQKRKQRESGTKDQSNYVLNLKDFKKNKGKLPWPVKGKIINKYGIQHNSTLKTTINNTGIDIKANSGAEVRSVFVGLVSMITYLSGYGNTIILDHGDGYYSVYSHLDEFFVEPEELVNAGHIIGLVGDSGSLEGSKLHFAIFSSQKTENPQKWLQ